MKWYVVHTHPREESLAREQLERQGFATYLPRYLKRRSHARRAETVPAALFPRYLFVGFDIDDPAWRVIRSTRGVIDLVRNGTAPVPVPADVVTEILGREADGYVVLGKGLNLERGDSFRIESGPFGSHLAIFQASRDNDRVVALLSLLGRKVVVEMPIGAVAPLSVS